MDLHWAQAADGLFMESGVFLHAEATVIPPVFLGAGAQVAKDVVLESAVIGRGTVVQAGATVRESILLDDGIVGSGATIERSILGTRSRVASGTLVPKGTVVSAWSRIGGDDLLLRPDEIRSLLGG